MGDELSRLASYEAECHRKDGVIAALRDEVVDLKGALQSSGGLRYGKKMTHLNNQSRISFVFLVSLTMDHKFDTLGTFLMLYGLTPCLLTNVEKLKWIVPF